jgi:peptide/nickel transport system permease protein
MTALADVGVARLRWRQQVRFPAGNRSLAVGLAIVLGMTLLSVAAPLLPLTDPFQQDIKARLQPPSLAHPFGTDNLGRDMLSRVIYGGQIDLMLGFVTATCSLVIGMLLGAFAGFYRGARETLIMRVVDALLALPFLVLVIAILAVVGPGLTGVYIGIIAVSWVVYTRITYAEMLVLRERQFILAARTLAFSDRRIILRHALPNLIRPNLAWYMSDIVLNILALTSLSYLGLGVQPPAPEWGALIFSGQTYLLKAWWISTIPGLVVVVVGVGFVLLGEWVTEHYGGGEAAKA